MAAERPVFLDLFCGCGGASIGYERAGLRAVLALDISEVAVGAYEAHSPGVARCVDLAADAKETLSGMLSVSLSVSLRESLRESCGDAGLALVHASPPCTDFSSAGPRREGASAYLSVLATEQALALDPRVFVLENVPGFLSSDAFRRCRVFAQVMRYDSVAFELDASLYGVPQLRRRAFWVCARGGAERLELAARAVHAAATARPCVVAQALAGSPAFFYLPPRGALNRGVHSSQQPAPTLRTNCANAMPAGYERRLVDAAEPAAAAQLDLAQLAALQTLPGVPPAPSRSAAGRLIGNALPPPLTEAVARALLAHGLLDADATGATGLPARFVPAAGAAGDQRETLSRRGSRRRGHIDLFSHAVFASAPREASEDDDGGDDDGGDDDENHDERRSVTSIRVVDDPGSVAHCSAAPGSAAPDVVTCAALEVTRKHDLRRIVATVGRCRDCDSVVAQISGRSLPPGWRLEVRDRKHTAFRRDDLYWLPPAASAPAPSSVSGPPSSSVSARRAPIRSRSALVGALPALFN